MGQGLKAGLGAQSPGLLITPHSEDSPVLLPVSWRLPPCFSHCPWQSTESLRGHLETLARAGPLDPHTSRDHGDSPERSGTGERSTDQGEVQGFQQGKHLRVKNFTK